MSNIHLPIPQRRFIAIVFFLLGVASYFRFSILLVICLALTPVVPAQTGHALLIGISRYQNSHMNRSPLKYPEADAKAMTSLLKSRGFNIQQIIGRDATKTSVLRALQDFKQRGTAEETLLIGLFGHGVQYADVAYFCPYDAQVKEVLDQQGNRLYDKQGSVLLEPAADSLVPLKEFLDTLNVSGAGSRILIADCCREEPNMARSRAFGSSVSVAVPEGTAVMFACRKGEKAFEHDDWQHGALTRALLDECTTSTETNLGAISAAVSKRVFDLVQAKTHAREQQNVHSIINGTVLLRRRFADLPTQNEFGIAMLPFQHDGTKFWMGAYEITQQQWHRIMDEQPSYFSEHGRGARRLTSDNPVELRPVENISWHDAMLFCERLSQREREANRLPIDWEYRLPTGREWEFVARLNKRESLDEAEILSKYAWIETNSGHQTHPVGMKESHALNGPKDMLGNVSEFCIDTAEDAETGEMMCLLRGGNFFLPSNQIAIENKEWVPLDQRFNWYGLRIVLTQKVGNDTSTHRR